MFYKNETAERFEKDHEDLGNLKVIFSQMFQCEKEGKNLLDDLNNFYLPKKFNSFFNLMVELPIVVSPPKYVSGQINANNVMGECDKLKNRGLLLNIMRAYLDGNNSASNSRFWLSSCIEAFLRGSFSLFQLIVARSGIFKNIVHDILTIQEKDNTNLQTSFDLLGETLKFNKRVFLIFEGLISYSEFEMICQKSMNNIIDSNVFLRAIVLSIHRFIILDERYLREKNISFQEKYMEVDEDYPSKYIYFHHISHFCNFVNENRERIIKKLLDCVEVGTISQTNISCINTCIILFIFEYKRNKLEDILKELWQEDCNSSSKYVTNLRELLLAWKDYYGYRPRDSLSLEYTTRIKTTDWKYVVNYILKCSFLNLPNETRLNNEGDEILQRN